MSVLIICYCSTQPVEISSLDLTGFYIKGKKSISFIHPVSLALSCKIWTELETGHIDCQSGLPYSCSPASSSIILLFLEILYICFYFYLAHESLTISSRTLSFTLKSLKLNFHPRWIFHFVSSEEYIILSEKCSGEYNFL